MSTSSMFFIAIGLVLAWGAGMVAWVTSGPRTDTTDPWQRYGDDRRQGIRVPPSVSRWTEADRQRQQAAHRRITTEKAGTP